MSRPYILCADDDRLILSILAQQLKEFFGQEVEIELAESGAELLEVVQDLQKGKEEIALVISDHIMPGMKGDELLIEVHKKVPEAIKILLTGQAAIEAIQNALNKANLYRYISKPWEKTDFLMTVKEALSLYQKNRSLREHNFMLQTLYDSIQQIQLCTTLPSLIDTAEKQIFTNLDVYLQAYWNPVTQTLYNVKGLNDEAFLSILDELASPITEIQLKKWVVFEKLEPLQKIYPHAYRLSIYGLALSDHTIALIGLRNNTPASKIQWLKLFYENLKIQADRCSLLESLEQRIQERTHEIQRQATIIQQQNQDILASVNYAKRIQEAILPKINIKNCHLPFHYIYEPRDIISGDFYWYERWGDFMLFALGDCTGHGVPGAMLSTLSISILHQIIAEHRKNPLNPTETEFLVHELLNQFAQTFSESLNRTFDYHAKDGLELGLMLLNTRTYELQFAGANMDLWIVRKREIIELKGDKKAIEGRNPNFTPFHLNRFQCEPHDYIILLTDGIVDQFGGEENKKFGYKNLRHFFIEHLLPSSSPNLIDWLRNQIKDWQGDKEQTDDRTCFAFKIQ